jgi:DNA-binding NarL/FixJ family response regulator
LRVAVDVLVLEDHVLIAELLARSLRALPGQVNVTLAHDVTNAIAFCRQSPPDLLILDLSLPDGSGVTVAEALLDWKPDARVIVLSSDPHSLVCTRHLHRSIAAVIDKTDALDRLNEEVRAIQAEAPDPQATGPLEGLTGREVVVLQLIGQGLSTEEIAQKLKISLHTAKTHRRNITSKLGVKGGQLVLLASALDPPRS